MVTGINAQISFWGQLTRPESHTLEQLWSGLCYLYRIVKNLEQTRVEQDPMAKDFMGTNFDADCGSGDPMLLNYFLWYSCSADSFLDLFSIAFATKKNPKLFRNMRNFRDNVGAHVIHANPNRKRRRNDNRQARSVALCQHVAWHFGRYAVGHLRIGDPGTGEFSPDDWGWALTEVHEALYSYISERLAK